MVKEVMINEDNEGIVEKLLSVKLGELTVIPVNLLYEENPSIETMVAMRVPGGFIFRVICYETECDCDRENMYVFVKDKDLPKVEISPSTRVSEFGLVRIFIENNLVPIVKDWTLKEVYDDDHRWDIDSIRATMNFLDGKSNNAKFDWYRTIEFDGLYFLPNGDQYEDRIRAPHDVGSLIRVDGRLFAISRSIFPDWHVVELDPNFDSCSIG